MDEVDDDGNVLWHGVKLGEFWKTDMQVAINDSNRREDASFSIRMGRAGTAMPYQQPIPTDFTRYHGKALYMKDLTLEVPTGRTWTTVMRPNNQAVRFGRGWRQFSVDNNLREGYQLFFTLVPGFRFRVQFFDHLGKRCTSYPPLPGSAVPVVAETRPQPDLQSGSQPVFFQPEVDGGQACQYYGSEAQTSAVGPLLGTTSDTPIPLSSNSDQDNVILRQYKTEVPGPEASLPHEQMRVPTFDPRNDSEETETEDEETAEDNNHMFVDSDNDDDDLLFPRPPPMQPPVQNSVGKILTLNELVLRKRSNFRQAKFHQAKRTHFQPNNSSDSSDDEPPDIELKKAKKPVTRKKRGSPSAPPVAGSRKAQGESSGSSPAMRLLQRQGCMRFSDIVSKCKRRDVSTRERRMVQAAAKQFASKLGNEKFVVLMRDAQVYQRFHLEIPGKILEATGMECASKVEVCLMDREQAQYKAHWTRQNSYDAPLLDRDAWAKFAVDHALEEGDVCVFQLLPQLPKSKREATFLFYVHIFRVVETLDFSDAMDTN